MELTTECGGDYAPMIRTDSEFTANIEQAMKLAIMTLQFIVPFVTHSQSFSSSYRRINDFFSIAIESNNDEIAAVLIEMMSVSLTNNSKFFMNVMDHIMKLMTSLHGLREILYYLIQKTKQEVMAQMKKKMDKKSNLFSAFFQSMHGGSGGLDGEENDDDIIDQMDYSEEDKEMLKQAKRKEREEQTNARKAKENQSDEAEGKKEKNPFGNDNEEDGEEGGDVLNSLKNKIKLLQYQLQCQQINALKTLNQDLITIQSQLVDEFRAIPLFSSFSDLLNDKMKTFRQSTRQLKPAQLTSGNIGSTNNHSVSSNGKENKLNDISESVFTLIAECVDNSLFLFRNTIMTIDEFYLERVNINLDSHDDDDDDNDSDNDEEEDDGSDDIDDFLKELDDIYDFDLSNFRQNKKKSKKEKKEKKDASKNKKNKKSLITYEEIIRDKIHHHFSWLFCLTFLNNEANVHEMMMTVCQQKNYQLLSSYLAPQQEAEPSNESKEDKEEKDKEKDEKKPAVAVKEKYRIALLPDYRSKLIYFGSMVDVNQVNSIIQQELTSKLNDIMEEWNEARSQTSSIY